MTASRLARAGRYRFFIVIVALLLLLGFLAVFHSSQQQLDESRKVTIRCEQQQEVLNARMQAIVDHKFQLEKSLESERKDHLETKQKYEQKAKEEKDIHAKATLESNVRFDSLQQHYKLLQSDHGDLVEDCSKAKETHLEQLNGLERKVKSLQTQLLQAKSQREKDIEHWKVKYDNLDSEMKRLIKKSVDQSRVEHLEQQIEDYKSNCAYRPAHVESTENNALPNPIPLKSAAIVKDFKEQIAVSEDLYKISIKLRNNTNQLHETNNNTMGNGLQYLLANNGVGRSRDGSVINSVENFQIIPKPLVSGAGGGDGDVLNIQRPRDENKEVLQQPPSLKNAYKSSTSPTELKAPINNYQAVPAVSPVPDKSTRSSTRPNNARKNHIKPLPYGVAPVPDNFDELIKNDEKNDSGNNNNRYANVVEELSGKKDDTEQENGAHEIKDNDFNLADEKNDGKDHLQEVLDNVNNAAEEDTNNLFDAKPIAHVAGKKLHRRNEDKKEKDGREDDEIHMIGSSKHAKVSGADNALIQQHDGDDKLINEVAGDQGKEAAFPDGMHMEEQNEEDDQDEDEYLNPAAQQQEGLPVRN